MNDIVKPSRWMADASAMMVGIGSLYAQVFVMRRLLAVFSGNELTIGLALAAWMIFTGTGAILAARISRRLDSPATLLQILFLIGGLLIIPAGVFSARLPDLFRLVPGEMAGLHHLLIASTILAAPFALCMGGAFPLAASLQAEPNRAAGRAYRFEALGAFAAGLVLAIWLSGDVVPMLAGLAGSSILLVGAVLAGSGRPLSPLTVISGLLALASLAGIGLGASRPLERAYERHYFGDREVLAAVDTRHGFLAAIKDGLEITLFTNGEPSLTLPDPSRYEPLVHLPLIMAPTPGCAVVIGGSFSGAAREVFKHDAVIHYFPTDPSILGLERTFAPGFFELAADPRARVHPAATLGSIEKAGVSCQAVIVALSDPSTAAANRFYTEAFFKTLRDSALVEGGVVAVMAGATPPNRAYSPFQLRTLATVARTLDRVFDRHVALPLSPNIIIAGGAGARLTADPAEIGSRLQARGIETFHASPDLIGPDLDPVGISRLEELLSSQDTPPDTVTHPRGYLNAIGLWAEKSHPGAARLAGRLTGIPLWSLAAVPLLALAALFFPVSRGPRGLSLAAAAAAGFASIAIEIGVMIGFQMATGEIYHAVTILTAAFMAGLALGAGLQERFGFPLSAALTLLLAATLPAALTVMAAGGLSPCLASLLLAGTATGAVFPAAAGPLVESGGAGAGAGEVYGAELAGSAAGGALTGVLLVPVFGTTGTIAAAGLVVAATLLLMFIFGLRPKAPSS